MSFRLPRCARIIEKCKGDAEAAAEKLLLEGHSAEGMGGDAAPSEYYR